MGEFLKQNKFILKEEKKSFWGHHDFNFKVYDYHTGQLLLESFREFGQNLPQCKKGSVKELFSRLENSCIKILGQDKNGLITIKFGIESKFPLITRHTIYDEHDIVIGYFTPNLFSRRARYDVFGPKGEKLFCVKFKAFIPKMLFEANDIKLARLYRKWKNLLRPTYLLAIDDSAEVPESVRVLLLATVICTSDMTYGWSEYL